MTCKCDQNERRIALACSKVLAGEPIEIIVVHELVDEDREEFGDALFVQFLCRDESHHCDSAIKEGDEPKIMHWGCFLEKFGEQLDDQIRNIDGPNHFVLVDGKWVQMNSGESN
jgi:hypothetical protein